MDVLKSAFLLPFTAGNIVRQRNGGRGHDGTVSSLVMVMFIVALVFVTLYVTSSANIPVGEDPNESARYVLIVFIVLGIISLVTTCVFIRHESREVETEEMKTAIKPPGLRYKFLCLFALAAVFNSVMYSILSIYQLQTQKTGRDTVATLIWNIIAVMFFVVQTVFIGCHRNKTLSPQGSVKFHFGMVFILVADLAIWFETVLAEKQALDKSLNSTRIVIRNQSGVDIYNCTEMSSIECFTQRASRFVTPAVTGFCLVSLGFLLQIWKKLKHVRFNSLSSDYCTDSAGETASLLDHVDGPDDRSISSSQSSLTDTVTSNQYSKSLYISVAIGGILTAIMMVLIVVLTYQETLETFYVWQAFRLTFNIMFLIVTIAAFGFLTVQCIPDPRPQSMSSQNNVLLLSTFGTVSFYICGAYAGAYSPGGLGTLLLVESIVDILGVYYQTVLILQASRFRRIKTHGGCSIKNVFALLVTLNLGQWAANSFLEGNMPFLNRLKVNFYGHEHWDFAREIIFPICTFYRFGSAMAFYELYWFYKSAYVTKSLSI